MPVIAVETKLTVDGLTETGDAVVYEKIYSKRYEPEATAYTGKAEVCTIHFKSLPEQLPLDSVIIGTIEKVVAEKIAEQQEGKLLAIDIYRATGEWFNSYWKVDVTLHASPFAWGVVIPLIIVLLIVIGLVYLAHEVKEIDWTGQVAIGAGIGLAILVIVAMVALSSSGKGGKKSNAR